MDMLKYIKFSAEMVRPQYSCYKKYYLLYIKTRLSLYFLDLTSRYFLFICLLLLPILIVLILKMRSCVCINRWITCAVKNVIEAIDKENNKMIVKVIEGDLTRARLQEIQVQNTSDSTAK